ncbi:unnamed protein product [Adineta steineri]|uniref:Small ribosomal subunit protein mS31 n=1 Tax=Adineta steineri TaxID=433720 RepID=A0A813YHY6_9BILA|nr:unnamed protein product [Adineta steineri]CAF1431661.1 unnamed protein product [Adineta steineri]
MLALRRVSTIYQYTHPLSSYQYRFRSKKSTNDDESKPNSTHFNEELLNFERKNINTPKNTFKNKRNLTNDNKLEKKQSITSKTLLSNDDSNQTDDLLQSLNIQNVNRRKNYVEELQRLSSSNKLNLAKPFNVTEKKQRRDGEQNAQKQKQSRPQVILDTDSNEVKILTRQVADSLTPPSTPNESSNIEQELLDVLRGHRVVSKNTRRMDKKTEFSPEHSEQKQYNEQDRLPLKKRIRPTADSNTEQTTEAFSSLLRDIKLNPTRGTPKSTLDEDFIRDAVDGSNVRPRFSDNHEQKRDSNEYRRPMRDTKRRQEFMKPHQLWSGQPLGIFTKEEDLTLKISPIWDKYEEDEITRISAIPPRNAFEEMIQWTKDGILWKFPVDNEQDIGSEADIPFYEHVLLERHLQDFPNSPLIRQFMELVCVGLGRNPYWTVEQKLEHINWFRIFFNEKMHVFNETVHTGAIKTSAQPSTAKPVSTFKPKPVVPPPAPKVVPVVTPLPPVKTSTTASKK